MDCTLNVQAIALIQVPLGVLLENENCNDGMLNILQHFHQYVPKIEETESTYT